MVGHRKLRRKIRSTEPDSARRMTLRPDSYPLRMIYPLRSSPDWLFAGWNFRAPNTRRAVLWTSVALTLTASYVLVARACLGQQGAPWLYAAYLLLFVALPGVVCVSWAQGQSLSWNAVLALALPTGFALEIGTFLGLSALHARWLLPVIPAFWLVAAAVLARRRGRGLVDISDLRDQPGHAFALSLLGLFFVASATSQLYSESHLVGGLPARTLFHDWIYLISRAATIKDHWPLEDPSLVGTPLQYHYFLLVHVAAAAKVTGIELSLLFLRLVVLPLGLVLVMQAYMLGRWLSHRPWGGLVAGLLTIGASEVSFSPDVLQPVFLGLFHRWLYQSPTFLFGMIFFGALALAIPRGHTARHPWRFHLWLILMGAAATGAKGTTLPLILAALGLLFVGSWVHDRRMPGALLAMAGSLAVGFVAVYALALAQWGSGGAALEPLQTMRLSRFWREFFPVWEHGLAEWFSPTTSLWVASLACTIVIFLGTEGVRSLAVPYLLVRHAQPERRLALWLGALATASCAFGLLLHLDSYSQLYLLLPKRLPFSVLAAACIVVIVTRARTAWRSRKVDATTPGTGSWNRRSRLVGWASVAGTVLIFGVACCQIGTWVVRSRSGFVRWWHEPATIDPNLIALREAMTWVRQHTEPHAVLIANAFTPENFRHTEPSTPDHTELGVYYYYSALAERRLWVEGPRYLPHPPEAWRRMRVAADIFYHGATPPAALTDAGPCYLLIDHSLLDGAFVPASVGPPVFSNLRFEVYRLRTL